MMVHRSATRVATLPDPEIDPGTTGRSGMLGAMVVTCAAFSVITSAAVILTGGSPQEMAVGYVVGGWLGLCIAGLAASRS
jgi:hypothetical protein